MTSLGRECKESTKRNLAPPGAIKGVTREIERKTEYFKERVIPCVQ
jgi:hypothetical protein